MADVPAVGITNGVPDTGTGTVQTLSTVNAKLDTLTAKILTAPATEAKQDTGNTSLASLVTATGAAWTRGAGASDANTQRVTIDSGQAPAVGQTTMAASIPVVVASNQMGSGQYEAVAASQTAQTIGATGAAGDFLSHVVVSPATAGCGVVTVLDNATALVSFPGGGTTALPSLIPFIIPVGIISTSGAWKITTGANVSCVAVGKFT